MDLSRVAFPRSLTAQLGYRERGESMPYGEMHEWDAAEYQLAVERMLERERVCKMLFI